MRKCTSRADAYMIQMDLRRHKIRVGGGNLETKIIEPIAYDEQNGYFRQDGTVGTLTTDGNSPKHNNRIVENCRIRKLTPRECFRLMDFDDKDFLRAKCKLINDDETAQWFLEQESKVNARTIEQVQAEIDRVETALRQTKSKYLRSDYHKYLKRLYNERRRLKRFALIDELIAVLNGQ